MCREREMERPLQRCAKGIWSSHSGGTVPESTAGVTQPDMWYCSLESIVVIILVSTLHYISTQQGRGTWNNYPRSKRCHSSSRIRGSENRWWVWPAIQGRAEAHPSLSNLREPQRSQGSVCQGSAEGSKTQWMACQHADVFGYPTCLWGGRPVFPPSACTSLFPQHRSLQPSREQPFPPCSGHHEDMVLHSMAQQTLLWDPLTAPETSKDWLLRLIWTRQSKQISPGQILPTQMQWHEAAKQRPVCALQESMHRHRHCQSCSGQLGETKEMLRGSWGAQDPLTMERGFGPHDHTESLNAELIFPEIRTLQLKQRKIP